MDKDIFRILLGILGLILIAGIYLWDRYKTQRSEIPGEPEDIVEQSDNDSFSMVPNIADGRADERDLPSFHAYSQDTENLSDTLDETNSNGGVDSIETEPDDQLDIVQLYVIAHGDMMFSGQALLEAFEAQGLTYGDMKIYHRPAPDTQFPRFSVVNMVEPGTFPDGDYSDFQSPGIALFLQTAVVDRPQEAFDDMVQTGAALAARLRGELLDGLRNPVNLEVIQKVRDSLAE